MISNGTPVGNVYAAASFAQPVPEDQWARALLLRRLGHRRGRAGGFDPTAGG